VTSTPFSVAYGSGVVNGTVASDTVTFMSKTVPLTFGLADNVSQEFSSYPMDGIVGFGRLQNVVNNPTGVNAPTLIDVLVSENIITSKQFGIHLNGGVDKSNDGEINFGAPDSSIINGSLNYIAAIDNPSGFWELPIDSASVNGKQANIQSGVTAILDSGTSFMLLPPSDADAINLQIPGVVKDGETYMIPCDSSVPISLTFGGKAYNVDPQNYVGGQNDGACTSNIAGHQAFGPTQWLLGDTFLKNVYTMFDSDGSRVGFGYLKGL
jgi:hypothetical protein